MALCIYTDADNTLWDTDGVFRAAQLSLLRDAEILVGRATESSQRLDFVRSYDQAIAAQHHAHLKYPPALLLRALEAGLGGASPKEAARQVLSGGVLPNTQETSALDHYIAHLQRLPALLPTVKAGLELARARGAPLYVVTEGRLDAVRQKIQALDLEPLIDNILSATKSQDLYARLKERAAPLQSAMVGDQPDRDIQMAGGAGMLTVLVEGRFRPSWAEKVGDGGANAVVETFLRAIQWLLEESGGEKG